MQVSHPIRRPRTTRRPSSRSEQDASPLVRLWLLRMLVPLGVHRSLIEPGTGLTNDALGAAVGLGDWVQMTDDAFDAGEARADLRQAHQKEECRHRKLKRPPLPPVLAKNIKRLAKLVGLSDVDQSILALVVHLHSERLLDDTADMLGLLSTSKVFQVLSVLLDVHVEQIRTALSADGVLALSGLVSIDRSGTDMLRNKLNLLSNNFADHISSDDADPLTLLRDVVTLAEPAQLTLDHYTHIQDDLDLLIPYLAHATTNGRKGVNILVYGPPGTGKSELVKVLAATTRCELFEVASQNQEGNPVSAKRRLCAFRAAQSFFSRQKAVVLFDEVEDVFDDDGDRLGSSTAQSSKAWINRTLEGNPVPAFWVSNSASCLDRAFVRRFDLVIELPVPPRSQRRRILQSAGADWLDESTLHRLSASAHLAPAVVNRAASVVQAVAPSLQANTAVLAFERAVNHTLKAQGHPVIQGKSSSQCLPEVYDPAFVHADTDLAQVAAHLVRVKSGRLCLYGPPGTGKTAYARWLAEQMGCPLLLKRASDLMSMYVGGTEQNMAQAFAQATREGAVLLLDEVDSFLQDRRHAVRSWEVSQVNEMLTQMEAFDGVFVASTNLMAQLDQASLRRFDLKVKLDYLTPEQAIGLFKKYSELLFAGKRDKPKKLQKIGGSTSGEHDALNPVLARVRAMRCLTPGDFAAVARQNRFQPLTTPLALVAALEKECAVKEGAQRGALGFLA